MYISTPNIRLHANCTFLHAKILVVQSSTGISASKDASRHSTIRTKNLISLLLFKDNQQKFGEKIIKIMTTIVAVYFSLKISYLAVRIKLCWLRMAMDNHSDSYKLISIICSLGILHKSILKKGYNLCTTRVEEFWVKSENPWSTFNSCSWKSFWRREERREVSLAVLQD
jgi:hypothetical protein